MKDKERELSEALLNLAKGYTIEEVVEEYAEVDGEMRLTKRKETRRDIPPDIKAVQMLLDSGTDVSGLTDEQLEEEKARLLALLEKEKKRKKGEKVSLKKKEKKYEGRKTNGDGSASCGGEGRGEKEIG